jgi:DNA invertase Pin-like site-specific DNA recombinase
MPTSEKAKRRSFQPPQQKTVQEDMWSSSFPIDVMWGIYARQSTPAQVLKNFESTEMQTDDLIQYLVERGVKDEKWQLFDADLGLSGTLPIDKRTGLQELVEGIKAGIIKAVLVYQISRLFRDDTGVEYNTFAKICREHDCILVTADGMVFNFNNRMHVKMFRFLAEYAAEYIPQQIGLLQAARLRKARRGLFVGFGYPSRGYVVDYNKENKTYKKYILYPPHQEAVVNLFDRFYVLDGDLTQLCREIEAMPYVFKSFDASGHW